MKTTTLLAVTGLILATTLSAQVATAELAPEPATRGERATARRARLLARFDANGDGSLDGTERQALRAHRRKKRQDKKGKKARRHKRLLERFDADGDGKLSEVEQAAAEAHFKARRAERQEQMLAEFDADGDGELSDDERQTAKAAFRARRDERKAGRKKDKGKRDKRARKGHPEGGGTWVSPNPPVEGQ